MLVCCLFFENEWSTDSNQKHFGQKNGRVSEEREGPAVQEHGTHVSPAAPGENVTGWTSPLAKTSEISKGKDVEEGSKKNTRSWIPQETK